MTQKSNEMRPTETSVDQAVSGVIYQYGMSMYLIQVLETQIVNLIVATRLPRRETIQKQELVRIREQAFRQTMGTQLEELMKLVKMPGKLRQRVNDVVARRNRLAHRFFRENQKAMTAVEGNEELIRELGELQNFVVAVDEELTDLERDVWKTNGMTYPF